MRTNKMNVRGKKIKRTREDNMTKPEIIVEKLIAYARAFLHLGELDEIYFRNLLLKELGLSAPYGGELDLAYIKDMQVPDDLLIELCDYAVSQGFIEEEERERYSAYMMGMLSPLPSEVNRVFHLLREKFGPQQACDYLYALSVKNNYIQKTAIDRNLKWEAPCGANTLEITINLSKPEKSNKDIAKALAQPKSDVKYPECLLCKENEGFCGTETHPARGNLRTVSLKLDGEDWFVQYSPYSYYDEHCIAINKAHRPMHVDGGTIAKLLDFVDYFPNYFIGSNAALPIVGGSILAHEHFQGGRHLMPMHKAKAYKIFHSEEFPQVEISVLDWYNSVVRLVSAGRKEIAELAAKIIDTWTDYEDVEADIVSHTGETPHNAVTPIVRMADKNKYCVELILRNNRTSDEYPDGIFHAHPEYHNIKKEGIGIIEVMGLFILPGRLKTQLADIADILSGKKAYDAQALENPEHTLYVHRAAIGALIRDNGTVKDRAKAEKIVRKYVDDTCVGILENTGVFKRTESGRAAFAKFLSVVCK